MGLLSCCCSSGANSLADESPGLGLHSVESPARKVGAAPSFLASSFFEDNNIRDGIMHTPCDVSRALRTMQTSFYHAQKIGGRELEKLRILGTGGFGVIWLASIGGTELVAMKELTTPFIFRPGCPKSLERLKEVLPFTEAAIQSLMVHKNIVRTHWAEVCCVDAQTHEPISIDFTALVNNNPDSIAPTVRVDEDTGNTWLEIEDLLNQAQSMKLPEEIGLNMRIVMDYCEYGALVQHLSGGPSHVPRPLHAIARGTVGRTKCAVMTARDIVHALRLMHVNHIIHCDLKPQNILLAADPDDPRGFIARLADFGLSKRLTKGTAQITGITHGSPPYMAPEAVRDLTQSVKSDVYSFGLLAWEIWHGKRWFCDFFMECKRRAPNKKKPLGPNAVHEAAGGQLRPYCDGKCPEPYASIVNSCLALDPRERPTSKQLKHLLNDCLANCD